MDELMPTEMGVSEKPFLSGWKIFVWALGWLHGFSLLFWLVQLIVHKSGEPFFGNDFEKVTYYFGWITVGFAALYGLFLGYLVIAS
jgi:hypothetical protein